MMSATGPVLSTSWDTITTLSPGTRSVNLPSSARLVEPCCDCHESGNATVRSPSLSAGTKVMIFFRAPPAFSSFVNLEAFVNHDHALTEFLDIRHVVTRQQDGHAMTPVVITQELAHRAL